MALGFRDISLLHWYLYPALILLIPQHFLLCNFYGIMDFFFSSYLFSKPRQHLLVDFPRARVRRFPRTLVLLVYLVLTYFFSLS